MFVPVNLNYTQNHLWIRPIGREDIYVGITDYIQKVLGKIDFIEIHHEGLTIEKDKPFGLVHGANKIFQLIMPVTGKVLMINVETEQTPHLLNTDTYHNWVALITADEIKTTKNDFLSAKDYITLINNES